MCSHRKSLAPRRQNKQTALCNYTVLWQSKFQTRRGGFKIAALLLLFSATSSLSFHHVFAACTPMGDWILILSTRERFWGINADWDFGSASMLLTRRLNRVNDSYMNLECVRSSEQMVGGRPMAGFGVISNDIVWRRTCSRIALRGWSASEPLGNNMWQRPTAQPCVLRHRYAVIVYAACWKTWASMISAGCWAVLSQRQNY